MRALKLILLCIFFTQLTFGQTPKAKAIDYVLVGVFCGECSGHCAIMYKWNLLDKSNTILVDTTDSYFKRSGKLVFNTTINDKEKFEIASKIVTQIPQRLLRSTKPSEIFGCPDCTDGCGIYFEFRQGIKVKRFEIDYQTQSLTPDLKKFAEFLKTTIGQLSIK